MARPARGRSAPRPARERLPREAPGTVLRGPPITVTCDCGSARGLRYGEQWVCENCGRRWNTSQIPPEQYASIRKLQLRFRILPIMLGLLVAALAIFFTLTHNVLSVFFLLPCSMVIWFAILRPVHRARYRSAIARLPRWSLHPE